MTKTLPLLRWTFVRHAKAVTCEITVTGSQSYDVCVVPHWEVGSTVVESFDRPALALRRHAELAWYFREAGWKRVRHAANGFRSAA